MGIYRTTDPTQWSAVDGIIVNESAPAPNIQGVAANVAILVGTAERGVATLQEPGSIGQFFQTYGKNDTFGMNLALKNKKFGRIRFIRVVAAAASVATKVFQDASAANSISFTAKQGAGAYGNNIQVKIEAGSTTGKKYTIQDTTPGTVLPAEVYDNVLIASQATSPSFAASLLVTAAVLGTTDPAVTSGFVSLSGGADGTVADSDYQAAIAVAEQQQAGNVLFLDSYNSTRNGYLKAHAAAVEDKMVICCGQYGDAVSAAVADVANVRDTEGRIIYGYPYIQTSINGALVFQNPASWIASIISQTAPSIDPAYTANSQFLGGITGLALAMSRADYINLKSAGVCAFEYDSDIGYKIKSGIVTQISESSKLTILRRRMTDYLTDSCAKFLKNYQNAVNSKENRTLVKGAIQRFVQQNQEDGILPKDTEVSNGKASLVDTESLNTNDSIAAGFFKILWRQRIYSSMRYIVLSAEIGESVVVTAQG